MIFGDVVDAIVEGLTDFFASIGGSIIDFFINLIGTLISIVIFPINALIDVLFPDFSTYIVNFNNGLIEFFDNGPIQFIVYHIPPMTRSVILLYLGILLAYYSIIWTYRAIIVIPTIIRRLKFW